MKSPSVNLSASLFFRYLRKKRTVTTTRKEVIQCGKKGGKIISRYDGSNAQILSISICTGNFRQEKQIKNTLIFQQQIGCLQH